MTPAGANTNDEPDEPGAVNAGPVSTKEGSAPPMSFTDTLPDARVTRLGPPCCGLRPGDPVVDPDGRTDGVDTVGCTHVNVIDHDRVHHFYRPDELGAA